MQGEVPVLVARKAGSIGGLEAADACVIFVRAEHVVL